MINFSGIMATSKCGGRFSKTCNKLNSILITCLCIFYLKNKIKILDIRLVYLINGIEIRHGSGCEQELPIAYRTLIFRVRARSVRTM